MIRILVGIALLALLAAWYQISTIVSERAPSTPQLSKADPVETTILVGHGAFSDACTAEIWVSTLPKLEEMGIHDWAKACEEAISRTAQD